MAKLIITEKEAAFEVSRLLLRTIADTLSKRKQQAVDKIAPYVPKPARVVLGTVAKAISPEAHVPWMARRYGAKPAAAIATAGRVAPWLAFAMPGHYIVPTMAATAAGAGIAESVLQASRARQKLQNVAANISAPSPGVAKVQEALAPIQREGFANFMGKTGSAQNEVAAVTIKGRSGERCLCPHCGDELEQKDIYTDAKGWTFHRPCFRKGKGSIKLPEGGLLKKSVDLELLRNAITNPTMDRRNFLRFALRQAIPKRVQLAASFAQKIPTILKTVDRIGGVEKQAIPTPARYAVGMGLGGAAGRYLGGGWKGGVAGALAGAAGAGVYDQVFPNVDRSNLRSLDDLEPGARRSLQARMNRIYDAVEGRGAWANTYHKRILIPKSKLSDEDLAQAGYLPSMIAVPEAGQDRWLTQRHPDLLYHFHSHPEAWTVHKDEWPSAAMLKYRDRTTKERLQDLGEGIGHTVREGIPGMYAYWRNKLLRGTPQGPVHSPMVAGILKESPNAVFAGRQLPPEVKEQIKLNQQEEPEMKAAAEGTLGSGPTTGQSSTIPPPPTKGDGTSYGDFSNPPSQEIMQKPKPKHRTIHDVYLDYCDKPPDANVFDMNMLKASMSLLPGMDEGTEETQVAQNNAGSEELPITAAKHPMNQLASTDGPPELYPAYDESGTIEAGGKAHAATGGASPMSYSLFGMAQSAPAVEAPPADDNDATHNELDSDNMTFGQRPHLNA